MATKSQATYMRIFNALDQTLIQSDTTTEGEIFDTADFDMGITFAMLSYDWDDGTYTMKIEHGDEDDLSDAEDVDDDMLVYGTLPSLAASISEGDALPKEGIHSTKRYVRASVVSTDSEGGGGAIINLFMIAGPEMLPAPQDA